MIALLILAIFLVVAGIFFFFAATVGFLRFPDFYSRMHATGKGDTFGLLLCLLGFYKEIGPSATPALKGLDEEAGIERHELEEAVSGLRSKGLIK